MLSDDKQSLAGMFADLDTTTWNGGEAYLMPVSASNTSITLTSVAGVTETLPIFGSYNGFVTDKLQLAIPMTPNARHQLNHLRGWVAENGDGASLSLDYDGVTADVDVSFRAAGLANNAGRF
jgi:hypothetical protein